MFCQNCGNEMPGDSRFCPSCGARQDSPVNSSPVHIDPRQSGNSMQTPRPAQAPYPNGGQGPYRDQYQRPYVDPATQQKRNKTMLMVVGIALLAVFIIGILSIFIKPSINLNKYLDVTFEGYDTVGKAVVTLDSDKIRKDFKDVDIYGHVSWELDKADSLCNGDTVSLTWDCDDDYILEKFGYKLKYKDMEYTVKDLEEAETFDPFEGVSVEFSGIDPQGTAAIVIDQQRTNSYAEGFMFQLDRNDGLSNGDTVTLTFSMYYDDPVEYCIENYGVIPSPLYREYTVQDLNAYVRSSAEISEDCLDDMQSQAEDAFRAYVVREWDSSESKLESLTYLGNYLLTVKADDYWGTNNAIYLVYKAQIRNQYSDRGKSYDKVNDVYWFAAFSNIMVNPSGVNTVDLMDYNTPGSTVEIDTNISYGWFGTKTWRFYGYPSLDALYDAVVVYNSESYNHEDNVDGSTKSQPAQTSDEPAGEAGIIFPDSSSVLIDEADARALSDEELRYAINELYARHGYIFNDEELAAYYSQFDWYEGTVKSSDFTLDMFNDIEQKNVEMLQKERESR